MSLTTRLLENLQLPRKPREEDGGPSAAPPALRPAPPPASFVDQINVVHTALFGWPCDQLTPIDDYLACDNIHQVGLKMLDSRRFRWDIRDKIGLWPENKWVMTAFRGLKVWVNLFDGFVSFGVLHGDWENAEADFMLSWLKPGDGVIDAGANLGVFTLQAARAVGPGGKVHAFEPMKTTFGMLARSVEANDFGVRCVLYNEGLGAAEGDGAFHMSMHLTNPGSSYITMDSEMNSAKDGGGQPGAVAAGERIRIRPIDAIAHAQRIRFIKIDVEGFEPHVIRGAARTLTEHAPVILTEFFPRSLRAIGGITGPDYVAMLEKLGYRMSVFTAGRGGEKVTPANACRFDDIAEPISLVCVPAKQR
jgi:FkbM family methyltransferase